MFRDYRIKKTNLTYVNGIILASIVLILMFSIGVGLLKEIHTKARAVKNEVPLLLNSGISDMKDAEMSIIVWFDKRDIPLTIWLSEPTLDWKWYYKELQMKNGKVAATLTGQTIIDKSQEAGFFAWYNKMLPKIENAGGRVYLDERTSQAIDTSAYLSQTNADPAQCVLIDNMISTAAYQTDINTSVIAGHDQLNIQLLSRGKGSEGQSVLAIPVLIKEF